WVAPIKRFRMRSGSGPGLTCHACRVPFWTLQSPALRSTITPSSSSSAISPDSTTVTSTVSLRWSSVVLVSSGCSSSTTISVILQRKPPGGGQSKGGATLACGGTDPLLGRRGTSSAPHSLNTVLHRLDHGLSLAATSPSYTTTDRPSASSPVTT